MNVSKKTAKIMCKKLRIDEKFINEDYEFYISRNIFNKDLLNAYKELYQIANQDDK